MYLAYVNQVRLQPTGIIPSLPSRPFGTPRLHFVLFIAGKDPDAGSKNQTRKTTGFHQWVNAEIVIPFVDSVFPGLPVGRAQSRIELRGIFPSGWLLGLIIRFSIFFSLFRDLYTVLRLLSIFSFLQCSLFFVTCARKSPRPVLCPI